MEISWKKKKSTPNFEKGNKTTPTLKKEISWVQHFSLRITLEVALSETGSVHLRTPGNRPKIDLRKDQEKLQCYIPQMRECRTWDKGCTSRRPLLILFSWQSSGQLCCTCICKIQILPLASPSASANITFSAATEAFCCHLFHSAFYSEFLL